MRNWVPWSLSLCAFNSVQCWWCSSFLSIWGGLSTSNLLQIRKMLLPSLLQGWFQVQFSVLFVWLVVHCLMICDNRFILLNMNFNRTIWGLEGSMIPLPCLIPVHSCVWLNCTFYNLVVQSQKVGFAMALSLARSLVLCNCDPFQEVAAILHQVNRAVKRY